VIENQHCNLYIVTKIQFFLTVKNKLNQIEDLRDIFNPYTKYRVKNIKYLLHGYSNNIIKLTNVIIIIT